MSATLDAGSPLDLEPVRVPTTPARKASGRSAVRRALRTARGRVGAALTLLVLVVAAVGPFVAPHSPTEFIGTPFAEPGPGAPLGTDNLGRDVLSRVLAGGWELLLLAALSAGIGVLAGAAIGVVAALRGGFADAILMRGADVVLAFPQLVFALLLVSVAGPKTWLIVLAVAIAHTPQVARVVRSAALDITERDFVKSAELIGIPPRQIIFTDIMPNLTTPLMVEIGLRLTYSIIIIAGLTFLGFGIQPPDPSWGVMINENRIGLSVNPWAVIAPALLLAILTVGLNTFTDAVSRSSLRLDGRDEPVVPISPPGLEGQE